MKEYHYCPVKLSYANKMGANGCHTEPKAKYPNEIVGFFATAQNDNRRAFAHGRILFNRTVVKEYLN